jgi:hypothetical protein
MESADFEPHIVRITVVFGNPHRHPQAGQARRQLHFRPILRDGFRNGRAFKIVRHIRVTARSPTALTYWAWPRASRGSAARGDFDPDRSDVDFLVEFDRTHPDALSLGTYFGLKEALEGLLGRPVELVEPGAVRNPYLKTSIEGSREPVFAA